FRKAKRQGSALCVEFDHAQGLRSRDGGPLRGFSIAGSDGRFVWADARIVDQQVLVSAPAVREPVGVRYGWASNPDVNLENAAGLPASPFRSDEFPLVTRGVR
ncbi:MAG TPA: hypothetical protein VGP93_19215, partial [Polyangiaceae bacterium]|nr:hypothetical protein [Polyangiaceae bacterium]